MRAVIVATVAAVIALAPRTARACSICDLFDRQMAGEAWLHYEISDVERVDGPSGPRAVDNLELSGFRLHGILALKGRFGLHIGIDFAAGATIEHGGFAYDVAFYPLGVGYLIGKTSFIALGTGIVTTGATRTIDDGVGLPVELTLQLGAGDVRFMGRARLALLVGSHDADGPTIPDAKQVEAMAGLRFGSHYSEYGFRSGNGYFVAATYREQLGERFAGLTIGYAIDASTGSRHRR